MCGIAGLFDRRLSGALGRGELTHDAARMAAMLTHRGPDDTGVWADPAAGVALAFRRLAIVELSPAGHQPMQSASGRYLIVFNGEIYNHRELRQQLPDAAFRGQSDTETLLAAIEAWGLVEALRRSVGMFGIALWDRRQGALSLARDRMGEKPLYYGELDGILAFGSELKAIAAHPAFRGEVDPSSLALFMRHGYIPAPYSIYRGVRKLPPGSVLTTSLAGRGASLPEPVPYWSAREIAERGVAEPFTGSETEALDRLEALLSESVRSQMVADVPLGAFLSGGIDSSLAVALMQRHSARPIKTFSIGFHEQEYNEAQHAKRVAEHLKTDHHEWYVTPGEAQAVIPQLPKIYDEPFADSSQIPTFLVSQLARRSVTVSLSGDGGDELFYGYGRYQVAHRIWRQIGYCPRWARRGAAKAVRGIPPAALDLAFGWLKHVSRGFENGPASKRLLRAAEIFDSPDFESTYRRLVSYWRSPEDILFGAREHDTPLVDRAAVAGIPDIDRRMLYLDLVTYLPDDILAKVDRAAMAVSLETRAPFLDHRVVEFAWRLPMALKERRGQGKWLLRRILDRHVPQELTERPKMGFGIPVGEWLRGSLRDWAESLLSESSLSSGSLAPAPILAKWREHLSGEGNWEHDLWIVLMYQAWQESAREALRVPSQTSRVIAA